MSTITIGNLVYTYSGSTASVTGFVGAITSETIPETIDVSSVTYNVTSIENSAFELCSTLISITISNFVESIGIGAFAGCSALPEVTIPNSVTTIRGYAFFDCELLSSVTLPTNASFTTISNNTFGNCSALSSINIPNSVTTIESSVFAGSPLTSITISDFVTSISNGAFIQCDALTAINVGGGNTNYSSDNGVLFNKLQTSILQYPIGNTQTTYTIPNSVTTIGVSAFYGCSTLTSITIPNSVTSIGESAFSSCSTLTSITIPNSVTTIGDSAFSSCSSLPDVTIPDSVTSIGSDAFAGCSALPDVTIPDSVTTIGVYAFSSCPSLSSVTLPTNASFITISNNMFLGCSALSSITIPNSVTTIENSVFQNCVNLNKVYFLQTPTLPSIGTNAFTNIGTGSVGKYYSSVSDPSSITPLFSSISFISASPPTLTAITAFTGAANTLSVISYSDLVTNGNEVVDNTPYVFLVNSLTSGTLSIGATQGSAQPWNASTNNTINTSNNAYWTSSTGAGGLQNAFSVVIQDAVGAESIPPVQVQVQLPTPPPYPCFLEGSKILCFENNEEVYRPVENLRKGDLVKTIYNGYMPVCMLGTTPLYNPGNDYRVANRLYKCPKENYPALFEDLYITGCHSILVPWMTDDQWENTKAVNGNIYVTDNHFRLIACADEKAEPFNKEGVMNIYHVALDHHDICMNYGIYANGLLVESCSVDYLIKYSKMKILGENETPVCEDVGNVSNNMRCQLVDTC